MHITVVGTGYVGLVTGTCFAETGNSVVCVDIDAQKVRHLQAGELPIYEPDLDIMFARNATEGRLRFTTDLAAGLADAELVLLALPTPPNEDGSADLRHVLAVAEQLGPLLRRYTVIVLKSTVPVGTAARVREAVARGATVPFDVASNPEFLREGHAVEDFQKPERVVIGADSARAREALQRLYAPFVRQGNPVFCMDNVSAELTKYAANAFLATKITFMNEIAALCERVGADVDHVRRGMGSDSRIGKRFLFPGTGYGGSCFPKDVRALRHMAGEAGCGAEILDAVIRVNERQRTVLLPRLRAYFGGSLSKLQFAVWGLSFKPDTDDIREAPALYLIEALLAEGASVCVYDPQGMPNASRVLGDRVAYATDAYEALLQSDALVIMTEWAVFRSPDFERMASAMRRKVIFDGRNLYDLELPRSYGFHYHSIGRPEVTA